MQLPFVAQRVLGALIEKSLATPQHYPLSLNALQSACNQRSSRDPVTDLDEDDVHAGIDGLKEHQLVVARYATGSRVPKYAHKLTEQLDVPTDQQAVLAVLLLRGPQTPGELRTRTERLHAFPTAESLDETLDAMAQHRLLPLVTALPRRPGEKQVRFAHLLGGDPPDDATTPLPAAPPSSRPDAPADEALPSLRQAVADLGAELGELRGEVEALRAEVAALRSRP